MGNCGESSIFINDAYIEQICCSRRASYIATYSCCVYEGPWSSFAEHSSIIMGECFETKDIIRVESSTTAEVFESLEEYSIYRNEYITKTYINKGYDSPYDDDTCIKQPALDFCACNYDYCANLLNDNILSSASFKALLQKMVNGYENWQFEIETYNCNFLLYNSEGVMYVDQDGEKLKDASIGELLWLYGKTRTMTLEYTASDVEYCIDVEILR